MAAISVRTCGRTGGRSLSGCVFFFQAEDGIRDVAVTGVQTCALPICRFCGAGLAHAVAVCAAVLVAAPLRAQTDAEPQSCRADAHAVRDARAAESPVT